MQLLVKQLRVLFHIRSKYTFVAEMNKVYLRHLPDSDRFNLSLHLKNDDLKVNRYFNFSRSVQETAKVFLSRVAANIEKQVNKKKKNKNHTPVTVEALLYSNNKKVDDETICLDIFQEKNDIVMECLGEKFQFIVNAPYVDNIGLPKNIMANFSIYPINLEYMYVDINSSDFQWYKSRDKKEWAAIANGFIIEPDSSAIDCYLKLICTPRNASKEGPKIEVVSENVIGASPGICPFENRHKFTKNKTGPNEFRVVTYNILADLYCDSEVARTVLHPYCPPYALEFDYRRQLILKELVGYNADIICLQEVDKKFYNYDLRIMLGNLNYESEYSQKGGQVAEGVACFFNMDKFKCISSENVILSEQLETNSIFDDFLKAVARNQQLKDRFLERKTVLQLVALVNKDNQNIVLVANTHLYFHPNADHIRLLQGAMAIRFVQDFRDKMAQKHPETKISVLFCGDFNSVPSCGIYQLYITGEVRSDCIDWASNKEEEIVNLSVTQPFKLASACGTPQYTNFTAGFADCLDYIFYDKESFEVTEVIPLPSYEELTANTALPSVVFPSDHVSLCADLKWKQ